MRVFDWDKAARIIKERNLEEAYAGLEEDWFWTAGPIWKDGKPYFDGYTFLASKWAEPVIAIDDSTAISCWVYDADTEWDEDTKWPESALKIVEGEEER